MKGAKSRGKRGKRPFSKRADSTKDKEIAYQNKDIISKVLAEDFKGKTFRVYGLDMPEISAVLPTNLPAVKANELRLDNLFELADGSVAIVDYESDYNKEDIVKYLNYLTGIVNRYLKEKKNCPLLRMIVIYTGDIQRKQVTEEYDIGAVRVTLEPAFLSELDSEGIFRHLTEKVKKQELLDDNELMKLIILPLSYRKREEKEQKIRETVNLAMNIPDRSQQLFALAGILTFTDKLIDMDTAGRIREAIQMTKVGRIIENEKRQALAQLEEKSRLALARAKEEKRLAIAKAKKENRLALAKAKEENQLAVAKAKKENQLALAKAKEENQLAARESIIKMLRKNYPAEEIASIISGFSLDEIEAIRQELTIAGES